MIDAAKARPAMSGRMTGAVVPILRAEGVAAFVGALIAYHRVGSGWFVFAALFLAPDLSMIAYVCGGKIGGRVYNSAHTYLGPATLAFAGWLGGQPGLYAGALIWIAHIGVDRALGFGLKRGAAFGDTHLGSSDRPAAATRGEARRRSAQNVILRENRAR